MKRRSTWQPYLSLGLGIDLLHMENFKLQSVIWKWRLEFKYSLCRGLRSTGQVILSNFEKEIHLDES